MAGYFLVRHARGPAWDPARGRRDQAGWKEHATFIDRLSEAGKIPLGGPTGDINGQHTVLLVVHADSEQDARAMFADDPWTDSVLRIEHVERWTFWIGADRLPAL